MKELRGAFHLLTRPTDYDIRRQIATQANIPVAGVVPEEVRQLHTIFPTVTKIPTDNPLVEKYVPRDGNEWANWQEITQRAESLFGMFPASMSYGVFIPSYSKELHAHRASFLHLDGQHTSLLLGAMTPDTVREYAITVRDVYPTADCQIIDLKGTKTTETLPEIVTFHRGNALKLPFSDNSVNSVHTNFLLGQLEDKWHRSSASSIQRLLSEAARVLDQNGILLMIEPFPFNSVPLLNLLNQLRCAGFTNGEIKTPEFFPNRRDMDRYLCGTASKPLQGTTDITESATLIVARK